MATEYMYDLGAFVRDVHLSVRPVKRPGLSVARLLAHDERARRNLERFEHEKRQAMPPDDDGVTVTVRVPLGPRWNAVVRL